MSCLNCGSSLYGESGALCSSCREDNQQTFLQELQTMPTHHPLSYNEVEFVEPGRVKPLPTIVERVRANLKRLFTTRERPQ